MVKLASTLPKESERNGVENRTRALLDAYNTGELLPIIALVKTKDVHYTEERQRVPRIEVVHIEAVPDDQADTIRQLLVDLHDARVGHRKEPLSFGDGTDPEQDAEDGEADL